MLKKANPFSFSMPGYHLAIALLLIVFTACQSVGSIETASVTPLAPADQATSPLTVVFKWAIKTPKPGVALCSEVLTDKGRNPYDGVYEDLFEAGQATELKVALPFGRYKDETFEWGIRVRACNGQGRYFYSSVRVLRTSTILPPAKQTKQLVHTALADQTASTETLHIVPRRYEAKSKKYFLPVKAAGRYMITAEILTDFPPSERNNVFCQDSLYRGRGASFADCP